MCAKKFLYGVYFDGIAHWGRSAVGIDIVDLIKGDAGFLYSMFHAGDRANSIRMRSGYVVAVCTIGIADKFCVNLCTTFFRMAFGLQKNRATAFSCDKTIAVLVKWTAGVQRIVVVCAECVGGSQS